MFDQSIAPPPTPHKKYIWIYICVGLLITLITSWFYITKPGSLIVDAYIDKNKNHKYDAGETLLPDIEISLRHLEGNNWQSSRLKTDSAGKATFTGLPAFNKRSSYNYEKTKLEISRVTPECMTATGPIPEKLSLKRKSQIHLSFIHTCIKGQVFHDKNNNKIQDQGELGVNRFKLSLNYSGKIKDNVDTDEEGKFLFKTVSESNYTIYSSSQNIFESTEELKLELTTQENLTHIIPIHCNCITGKTFIDVNDNRILEPKESGLPDVDVILITPWDTQLTASTDKFGYYIFNRLPPITSTINGRNVYYVYTPNSSLDGDLEASGEIQAEIKLPPDGEFNIPYRPKSDDYSLTVSTFLDTNLNWSQDHDETILPGSVVGIFNQGAGRINFENPYGYHHFKEPLTRTQQTLIVQAPKGYVFSAGLHDGREFISTVFQFTKQAQTVTYGVKPQSHPGRVGEVKIKGEIFIDSNKNGFKDSNEELYKGRSGYLDISVSISTPERSGDAYNASHNGINESGTFEFTRLEQNKVEPLTSGEAFGVSMSIVQVDFTPTTPTEYWTRLPTDKTFSFGIAPK